MIAKQIRQWERRLIPNFRKHWLYLLIKLLISLPIITLSILVNILKTKVLTSIRFKRANKPDLILSNIIAGWANLALPNPVTEQVATKRASICATCPQAVFSTTVYNVVVDNKTSTIRGLQCNACGCPLSAKVRAMGDSCPLGKW